MPSHASRRLRPNLPFGTSRGELFQNLEMTSLYYAKDFRDFVARPLNKSSQLYRLFSQNALFPTPSSHTGRRYAARIEILERLTNRYGKPDFKIDCVETSPGCLYDIEEEVVEQKPFCRLLHFRKTNGSEGACFTNRCVPLNQPKLLIVAPYSGHYATLLRDTVRRLLPAHDVYITDWENGRCVPLIQGVFSLDTYIDYLLDFIEILGPSTHLLAVCQPAVPVLATTALLAQRDSPLQPASMTLMGGPIDTRINPTKVNQIAKEKPLEWFRRSVIAKVPHYYPGAGRRVCPGFLMLQGFMGLNLETHLKSHKKLFSHLTQGDKDNVEAHRLFYDEYRSVLDLPARYFLDSVRVAFQTHALPKGEMTWRGETIDTSAIQKTALLTVEGARDDISGVGQTQAAQEICTNLLKKKRHHHLQEGVGHYGVFNGRRWRECIAPVIEKFIQKHRTD